MRPSPPESLRIPLARAVAPALEHRCESQGRHLTLPRTEPVSDSVIGEDRLASGGRGYSMLCHCFMGPLPLACFPRRFVESPFERLLRANLDLYLPTATAGLMARGSGATRPSTAVRVLLAPYRRGSPAKPVPGRSTQRGLRQPPTNSHPQFPRETGGPRVEIGGTPSLPPSEGQTRPTAAVPAMPHARPPASSSPTLL